MQISEKKQIPLSIEKCQLFKPKREKITKTDLTIDLKVIEDNEESFNGIDQSKDSPCFNEAMNDDIKTKLDKAFSELKLERKSSTCSTSISKGDDFPEFNFTIPKKKNASPVNSESCLNNFFGRNIQSTPVSNYFRDTEEYLRGLYPERNNYSKTGNYITKEKFFKDNDIKISSPKDLILNKDFSENLANLSKGLNVSAPNTPNASFPSTGVPAVITGITPKYNSWGKGKFDLPMYYLRIINVDCK